MSTAQQLGLIGNSIKVQSLPTASAETFGAGNRFYTLIGQQEGYITGHTYHTVVANDVYSWEDIAQAGPQGEDGLPALVYNDTWGYINVGLFNAAIETFNRTPIVGEKVVIFSTENQYALATIESVSETTVGVRFSGPIIYTKGATGPQGLQGPQGPQGVNGIDGTDYLFYYGSDIFAPLEPSLQTSVTLSNFNRTPVVGDYGILIVDNPQGDSYIQVFNVKSIGETTCNITGVMYSRLTRRYYACNMTTPKVPVVGNLISNTKDPESNPLYEVKQDDLMVAFDTADIDGNVYLVLADIRGISKLTNGKLSVNAMIQAVSRINGNVGKDGAQGVGVKSITSGTPTIVDDKTNTPITITLTDNTTVDLVVSAENGKDGTSETVDIVQATGQSTTAVMSQKAVTDELAKKATTSEVNAKYTKPESGIPKSDLAEDVKTSLGKADTALQNVPSYNDLPNIPVINQDLTASGFTPVANTYYRHTGTTTASYINGVIYYYNGTGYAALDGSGSGGGKKYQLVKKTVRCTVHYDPVNDVLSITSPAAADKNILDVIKENNNCSLRLYRGLDNMAAYYVDLQPHQRREDKAQNSTDENSATKIYYDFTGGLDTYVK